MTSVHDLVDQNPTVKGCKGPNVMSFNLQETVEQLVCNKVR